MDVDLIFRIAAIGILVTVLNMVLKQSGRDEMALLTTIAGVVMVLLMVAEIVNLFDTVRLCSVFEAVNRLANRLKNGVPMKLWRLN